MKHTDKNHGNSIIRRIRTAAVTLLALCCFALPMVLMTGCTSSGAEAQVKSDLEYMRVLDIDEAVTEELTGMLDKEGRSNYYEFVRKAGEYNYKIIETAENEEDGSTIVTVRITAYPFGKAYLEAWSDFLDENPSGDFDPADFYDELMEHLSEVREKEYVTDVDIVCTKVDPDDAGADGSGESNSTGWKTNATGNYELKNAMLGGMLREIASLAEM